MSEHHYQMHDLTLRIRRPKAWPPWVFQKLDWFAGPGMDRPNIDVTVGPFSVDTGLYDNVDHTYYARPGELFFASRWNGVRYATRWAGLDTEHVKVELSVSKLGLVRFPWVQQADWITHMFVLKPIAEHLWARRNRYVLHAAAASRGGRAAVFTGFGSSLKTNLVMTLIRDGWELLGDDQVLLTKEGLLPMPIGLRTFDFRVNKLPDEYLTHWRTLRLGWHLVRQREPRVTVARGPAAIGAMNLLTRSERDAAAWEGLSADEAAARIVAQCQAETVQSVRQSPPIGQPMLALAMMDRSVDVDEPWRAMQGLLAEHLSDAEVRRVDLTRRWRDGLMDSVALGAGEPLP